MHHRQSFLERSDIGSLPASVGLLDGDGHNMIGAINTTSSYKCKVLWIEGGTEIVDTYVWIK